MDVDNGGQAAEAGNSGDTQTAELSLRDELVRNLAELKGETTNDASADEASTAASAATTKTAAEAPAETGKSITSTEVAASTTTEAKSKAPQSWSAADRAHWDKLPPEVQAIIGRREEEAHKGIQQLGQEAAFGRKINDIVNPYLPMIRAEGGNPEGAVRDLLQTAYMLRTGNADQKTGLFRQLAQQFGVDLTAVSAGAQQENPELASLRKEIAQLRGHLQLGEQQQHQQVHEQAQSVIEAFSADPKNEFYEQVKPLMGILLVNGKARDMQEAYDMACHADRDVRSTILTRQQADVEAKRAVEAKARTDAKRRAGGSISGSPGTPVPTATTANPNLSLRDELRAQFRAATSS